MRILIGLNTQSFQLLLEENETRHGIGKVDRFHDLALIWLEHTTATRLAADINTDDIPKLGGVDQRRRCIGLIYSPASLAD